MSKTPLRVKKNIKKDLTNKPQQVILLYVQQKGEIMSITQNLPVHTGTFITQKGDKRTMNFIKISDLPSSMTSLHSRVRKLQPGFETVYDIDKNQYRTFNNNTVVGSISVSSRSVTFRG